MTLSQSPRPVGAHPTARPVTASRWGGASLIGLAVCLAAIALLGPLVTGAIDYRISDDIVLSQLIGLDAVSLALVAPLALTAGALALRGDARWAVLGFGPAIYAVYMVPQYVLGPDYLQRAGNNERFFPLFLALLAFGAVGAVAAWAAMELHAPARSERLVARTLLPVAAGLAFVRYIPLLAEVMSASPTSRDYLAGPVFVWTIALLDLGLALPATVAACAGYRRGAAWAHKALVGIVSWLALVGIAVGAMAVAMYVRDDPGTSIGGAAAMIALAAAFTAIAALLLRPRLSRSARAAR